MLRTSLMVSCLVLLPLLAAAQDVDTASAVQTARSDAPPSLRALGITQLAVDVESASHVAISLFRATGEVSHTVEIDVSLLTSMGPRFLRMIPPRVPPPRVRW